ncbi:MAG: hypothetical protein GTO31_12500, partial [Xanthomonadales bacterium]|nr:hypothetical protein [Xanthomonadales bacterium]
MLYPTIWRRQSPNLWDEMFNIRNEFDRLLGRGTDTEMAGAWCPAVDVREGKNE